MRSGERLAVVDLGASVRDALLAMTRARSGAVAVLDGRRMLAGVFTDGDLRRLIGSRDDLPICPVAEVMTRDPLTVRSDELAVTVLQLFEKHNVDDLLVVDAERHLVGLVDLQDLPKFKIL
ncbi:MAG: CBS domain-containing protein [Lentisphaerae bacterium]|nr:CBS domain-containing protein [Lentisphaerota bacterium]